MSGQIGMGFYGASDPTTMADVYKGAWRKDVDALEKLASDGTVGITTSAAFNAIYGPKIFNLAYNRHNTMAALGAKPYFTGVRFQQELSNVNLLDAQGRASNGGVIRGGYRQKPRMATYATVEEPYKVNEWNFAMEFGMIAINGIDDVLKWEQQMDLESKTWLNTMNAQILTKIESAPIAGTGEVPIGGSIPSTPSTERVGLESIERIISNSDEAQYVPSTYAVPWYSATNLPSSDGNALSPYRDSANASFSATSDNNYNSYVDANYNNGATVGESTNRQLNLSMIDNMFNTCMPYWEDNGVDGKVLITGYDTMTKLQAILQPQQRYHDATFAKISVNGISTVEGRGAGFQVSSYNGVPILPDRQVPKGTVTKPSTTAVLNNDGVGRIYLVDNANLARGIAKATVVNVSDNPLVTDVYSRVCNMYDLSELQCTGFRGQGKIIHLK